MSYQGWYHAMGNTFGTWLPGDGRGFRSYKHREHCDGDYKTPPSPGKYQKKHQRAVSIMKRPPVLLTPPEREIVCVAMAEKLIELGAQVIDVSMTDKHFYALANFDNVGEWITLEDAESRGIAIPRLSAQRELVRIQSNVTLIRIVPGMKPENTLQDDRDPLPRHLIGLAKKHASHTLRQRGCIHEGGVFAVRCKVRPIEDRAHKQNVEQYIYHHKDEGAAVLSIIARRLTAQHLREGT